jgi:hypothetical protein
MIAGEAAHRHNGSKTPDPERRGRGPAIISLDQWLSSIRGESRALLAQQLHVVCATSPRARRRT